MMSSSPVSVIDQVAASLSASALQHQVIASNIANRNAEGYRRLKVQFDAAMDAADITSAKVVPDMDADPAEPVSIEQDMVALSANSMRYESLARSLSRYFALIATITSSTRG